VSMNRTREPTKAEMGFATRVASGALVGFFDPAQFEKDKARRLKYSYSQLLKDRARFQTKIMANYDARLNATGAGCRIMTDNEANEAAIVEKEMSLGVDATDQDRNDEFDRAEADRKHAEKTRRAKAKLAKLQGASIDLGGAAEDQLDAQMDEDQDPQSEYEDYVEYESPKKKSALSKSTPISDKKVFFGALAPTAEEKPEDNQVRVRQIARLAFQVRRVNPAFLLNEEEERALKCIESFPEWIKANYSPEETDRVMQALLNQPVKR